MRPCFKGIFTGALILTALVVSTHTLAQYPARPPVDPSSGPKGPSGWQRLKEIGPGRDAVVTLGDGTLRGGWITGVDDSRLTLSTAGKTLDLAAADIATVRVKRPNHTWLYGVIGYLVTASVATIVVNHDGDHEFKDHAVVFSVAGIPGGLIGAAIGHGRGGDVEIVP